MKKQLKLILGLLLSSVIHLHAQDLTITGIVQDEQGEPLPGASVVVTGTQIGVSSDFDGNFSITVPDGAESLSVSYIGFQVQQVPLTGSQNYTVTLVQDSNQLDEVVIIGYGAQRKEDATSAVERVTAENFNKASALGVGDLIQGKVAGLNITKAGSDPTQGSSLQLRGPSTISGGNSAPFFVVDGVPGASLAGIAPQDIESIDVLKDASATAIYGTRGANGVIIVTTKRPVGGDTYLNFSSFVATEMVTKNFDVTNAAQLAALRNERGITIDSRLDLGADTDWQDEITRSGFQQNYNVTFGGGTGQSNYTASMSYVKQEGVVKTNESEEIRGRIRAYSEFFDGKLKADVSILGSQDEDRLVNFEVFHQASQWLPTVPVRDANGNFSEFLDVQDYRNPVSLLENDNNRRKITTLTGLSKLSYNFTDNFKAEMNSVLQSTTFTNARYQSRLNPNQLQNGSNAGQLDRSSFTNKNTTFEFFLNYNNRFKEKHSLDLLAGYSWQKQANGDGLGARSIGFFTDRLDIYGLGTQLEFNNFTSNNRIGYNESRIISFFGRATYQFNDKYIFTGSIRRDGSSKFGANNKWGNFPAASVGWKISEEEFLQNSEVISNLKFRAGWGIVGNQDIPPNRSIFTRAIGQPQDVNGVLINTFPGEREANPDLQWEETTTTNIGLEFGLFNQRLTGSVDVYSKITDNLFFEAEPVGGFADTFLVNGGELSNKGVEIALQGRIIQNQDFSWSSNFNIAFNRNKIENLDAPGDIEIVNDVRLGDVPGRAIPGQTAQIRRIGESLGTFFTLDYLRTEGENRIYRAADGGELVGGDGSFTDNLFITGSAQPDYTFNWGNDFTYKNFNLSFLIRGMMGHEILNGTRLNLTRLNDAAQYNVSNLAISEGITDVPRVSDFFLEDGSFIRLDNITLTYNIPVQNINFVKNAAVTLSGENLFTITDYTGLDPEIDLSLPIPGIETIRPLSANNGRGPVYFRSAIFTLGLNVNF